MNEAFFATMLFWSAFTYSAGPFWTATMAAATTTSFKVLYKNYITYLILGWLPLIVLISAIISQLGSFGNGFAIPMHILGSLVIFYMAWKIYSTKPSQSSGFDFNWKAMSILSWSNPKVWLLVPLGFISANITQSQVINIGLYYLIGIPFFLSGVLIWGTIGRLGAKISLKHINTFNALLMALFGLYLLYGGWGLLQG